MRFKIGDLIFDQSDRTGLCRYCVIQFVKNGSFLGYWADTKDLAIQYKHKDPYDFLWYSCDNERFKNLSIGSNLPSWF
jgi:hypothetical protein